MENDDIRILLKDLPTSVKGFVYLDSTYQYVIVLNSRMTKEIQQETYRHELDHIKKGEPCNLDYREYAS